MEALIERVKYWFVKRVYADHNGAGAVQHALSDLLRDLGEDAIGLNIGAGKTRLDPRVRSMELDAGEGIDYVGSVENIPCADEQFDVVVTQEVLEHVADPQRAVREIWRVLKAGGCAYIQLPFTIGYHPCPGDYWRFTREGLLQLIGTSRFEIVRMDRSVGPAVGFYRILVEFGAIVVSVFYWRLYKPAKLICAFVFFPIKLLDPILLHSREADRIAGGYFVVCRKVA